MRSSPLSRTSRIPDDRPRSLTERRDRKLEIALISSICFKVKRRPEGALIADTVIVNPWSRKVSA